MDDQIQFLMRQNPSHFFSVPSVSLTSAVLRCETKLQP